MVAISRSVILKRTCTAWTANILLSFYLLESEAEPSERVKAEEVNTIIESSESGGETKPADWSGPGFPTELNNPGWPVSLAPTGDDVAANGVEHSAEDAKEKKIFSPTPGTSLLPNSRARTVESLKVKLTLPGAAQTDLGQSERDDCVPVLAGDEGVFSQPSSSSPLPTGGVKRKLSESPQVS